MRMRHSDQAYTDAWIMLDHNKSIKAQLERFMEDHYWIYDADVCGHETVEFVVDHDGDVTFWQAEHAWWIDWDPEWELHNEIDINQVDGVNWKYPRIDRDWMIL